MRHAKTTIGRTFSKTISVLIALPIIGASALAAEEFCADAKLLTSQARANFLDEPALAELSGAERCVLTRSLLGGNAYHCSWKFDYRDNAADIAFDRFEDMIKDCFSDAVETVEDEGVNHPDSYRQNSYLVDQAVMRLSIKDKTARQETYVFVSVEGLKTE